LKGGVRTIASGWKNDRLRGGGKLLNPCQLTYRNLGGRKFWGGGPVGDNQGGSRLGDKFGELRVGKVAKLWGEIRRSETTLVQD